ncbi:MAG: hypothetical protein H7311_00195 [Ramlibacter sp.]|nr:hypothetical protein [Cryobacterium sp.]
MQHLTHGTILPDPADNSHPVAVAKSARHLARYPFSGAVVDAVRAKLDGFSLSRGTIRFTADHPLPDDVVEEIVRARLAQIKAA